MYTSYSQPVSSYVLEEVALSDNVTFVVAGVTKLTQFDMTFLI